MIKKAMIMAAGVGSRLGALSDLIPKPIVPLANIPAMDIIIKYLAKNGIKQVIANTYYKADYIKNHYEKNTFGSEINLVQEDELSGTAGGLKKCQFFFDKNSDFIVMSGDGLSDIDIQKAYESHKKSNAVATVILTEVPQSNVSLYGIVVPDKEGFVKYFQEKPKISEAKSNLANTGIYIFNYRIFDYIPENTFYDFAKNVFPSLLENNEKINTFKLNGYWSDIGSIEQYKQSNFDLLDKKIQHINLDVKKTETGRYIAGENFSFDFTSQIFGNCIFGKNCKIERDAKIINSVIWDNVCVKSGIKIENSIVLSDTTVDKDIKDTVYTKLQETITV